MYVHPEMAGARLARMTHTSVPEFWNFGAGKSPLNNDYYCCCCCYRVLRILGLSHRSAHLLPDVRPRQAWPRPGSIDVGCCNPLLLGEFVRSHRTNGRYSVK